VIVELLLYAKMLQLNRRIILFVAIFASFVVTLYGECPHMSIEYNNDTLEILSPQYCFVNECTIKINESNMFILNTTGDLITVANMTNMFTAPANGTNCISNNHKTGGFVFLAITGLIIIISSSINILVHIFIKEYNVMSVIVICLCTSVDIAFIFQLISIVFQYLITVHNYICGTLKYGMVLFFFMHKILEVTYLSHFGYLMYRSYRVILKKLNNRMLLCIYVIATGVATLLSVAILIVVDLTGDRSALATSSNGYCDDFNYHFATSRITFLSLFSTMTLVQVIVFIIAITLYLLVTKSCCGKSLNDARVSVILISTTGLNALLFITLQLAGVKSENSMIAANTATCVEQITLLIIFSTYKKSRERLQKIFCKYKNTYSFTIEKAKTLHNMGSSV